MRCRMIAISGLLFLASACGNDEPNRAADAGAARGGGGASGGAGTGGAGGAAPTVTTGLPPEKKLSDLTPTEATMACEKVVGTVTSGSFSMDYCKLLATLGAAYAAGAGGASGANGATDVDAELRALCAPIYDGCIADGASTQTAASQCDDLAMGSSDCDATVAELESCANDRVAALHDVASKLPACDKLTQDAAVTAIAGSGANPLDTTKLAACNALNKKCPGVVGGVVPPRP